MVSFPKRKQNDAVVAGPPKRTKQNGRKKALFGNAVERAGGETASRINSVVLEISSTNQMSVPVAQPIYKQNAFIFQEFLCQFAQSL